jgi:hypothetical protein
MYIVLYIRSTCSISSCTPGRWKHINHLVAWLIANASVTVLERNNIIFSQYPELALYIYCEILLHQKAHRGLGIYSVIKPAEWVQFNFLSTLYGSGSYVTITHVNNSAIVSKLSRALEVKCVKQLLNTWKKGQCGTCKVLLTRWLCFNLHSRHLKPQGHFLRLMQFLSKMYFFNISLEEYFIHYTYNFGKIDIFILIGFSLFYMNP